MNKNKIIMFAIIILFLFFWFVIALPVVTPNIYSDGYSLKANIFSVDNFFDEQSQTYTGEQKTNAIIEYSALKQEDTILTIANTFDVFALSGENIVTIDRIYGINTDTLQHESGYGDKDRDGYLFAPKNVSKDQSFQYWHVNYDAPATMTFIEEEKLFGLSTYKYQSDYSDQVIDQTANLHHLPGVPEERGVVLEPELTLWVEPSTGHLVKYHDKTLASYYDIKTGAIISPWNSFSNRMEDTSVKEISQNLQAYKFTLLLQRFLLPFFVVLSLLVLTFKYPIKTNQAQKYKLGTILSILVFVGGAIVAAGWILDIDSIKSLVPGLVSMKITTALSFMTAAIVVYFGLKHSRNPNGLSQVLLPIATFSGLLIVVILIATSILGVNSGIESLFIEESHTAVLTASPGQPSVGTLLCFLLIFVAGLIIISTTKYQKSLLKMISLSVTALASAALLGYVINQKILYYTISGRSTAMAFHTAILFVLLAIVIWIIATSTSGKRVTDEH